MDPSVRVAPMASAVHERALARLHTAPLSASQTSRQIERRREERKTAGKFADKTGEKHGRSEERVENTKHKRNINAKQSEKGKTEGSNAKKSKQHPRCHRWCPSKVYSNQ